MKLYIESEGERHEAEAQAAYVTLIDPADRDADEMLMVMGKTSPIKIINAVAYTLDGLFDSLSGGDSEHKKFLWKDFKKAYKRAGVTGSSTVEQEEFRPVTGEESK